MVAETAYSVLGACYFETGAYGPALKDFEGALRLDPFPMVKMCIVAK